MNQTISTSHNPPLRTKAKYRRDARVSKIKKVAHDVCFGLTAVALGWAATVIASCFYGG